VGKRGYPCKIREVLRLKADRFSDRQIAAARQRPLNGAGVRAPPARCRSLGHLPRRWTKRHCTPGFIGAECPYRAYPGPILRTCTPSFYREDDFPKNNCLWECSAFGSGARYVP
jgi:hypothetical protein